ncbi:cyclic lactone autoinducer peptide [Agathobaculum sp. NTUH-O15-33]|nr:cyclic lactone autoinducer peptide [Agathobaculum sp. NTUH-O15-33]WNX84661.1 cyclic lactone autoinducer peptide [Agathobaculum sp. NTUH-O15-33]
MKKLYGLFLKSASALAALTLVIATVANGSTCWFTSYQPEEPDMD